MGFRHLPFGSDGDLVSDIDTLNHWVFPQTARCGDLEPVGHDGHDDDAHGAAWGDQTAQGGQWLGHSRLSAIPHPIRAWWVMADCGRAL